jgi:hypothetical protein
MTARSFFPSKDAQLVEWGLRFGQLISLSPAIYGLLSTQTAAFTVLATNFDLTWRAVDDKSTRSKSKVLAKNTARELMKADARRLASIIYGQPNLSPQQISELGLTVKKTRPTPRPAPGTAPTIDVVEVSGWTMTIALKNGQSVRRGKPVDVQGASLFTYVGPTAPINVTDWTFATLVSKTTTKLVFDSSLPPGTTVWVTAFWFSPALESGPAAKPVSAQIQFGGISKGSVRMAGDQEQRAA